MNRIAIISDIHGNLAALKSSINEIEKLNCDQIICLGDVCGYYSSINECIKILIEMDVIFLVGNHDHYIISDTDCPRSVSANMCLTYHKKIITKENLKWLSSGHYGVYKYKELSFVHGGWNDTLDEYMCNLKNEYFDKLEGQVYFSGHTHVQTLSKMNSKVYCNPGSVGQPRDGNPHAAYAIYDSGIIHLKRVEYNIDDTVNKMKKLGFPDAFSENLYNGTRIGGAISKISITK